MIDRWATPAWRTSNGTIETLRRVPVGETPFKESHLRDLLAETPSLLPVRHFDQVFADPVSLGTEFPIADVGRIDALFLSPTGYLTIAETKLWRNPEARRKVVAQIIDYAQRLAKWSYRELEDTFQERRTAGRETPVSLFEHVCDVDDDAAEEAEFVNAVTRCLRDGRFLLLVVGDGIREGVEDMAEALQQTPTLGYTLGLVELACYQRPGPGDDLLFVPQVVTRTAEIIRAIVRVDLHRDAEEPVKVSVPREPRPNPVRRPNRLSEDEFYVLLGKSASADSAEQLREFVGNVTDQHKSMEVSFTPTRMHLAVERPRSDETPVVVLAVSKNGTVRTVRAALDYLAASCGPEVVQEFIDDLGAVDERLRPIRKPGGTFLVQKGSNAADLVTIAPKLTELAAVVSKVVQAVSDCDTA